MALLNGVRPVRSVSFYNPKESIVKNTDVNPVMHKFAREIELEEMALVSGGDTVGSSGPKQHAAFIETLNETGSGPDTVNGKPGTGWTETYG